MKENMNYLRGESDIFIGKRSRLKRYLVCSMEGYFPVLTKTGPNSAAAIFRTGAPHVGINATLAVSTSADGGKCWSAPVEIVPRWEDARNPAFGVNSKGELIAAFWRAKLHNYESGNNGYFYNGNKDFNREGKETAAALFTVKSSDRGKTWGEEKPYVSKLLKSSRLMKNCREKPVTQLMDKQFHKRHGRQVLWMFRQDPCRLSFSIFSYRRVPVPKRVLYLTHKEL